MNLTRRHLLAWAGSMTLGLLGTTSGVAGTDGAAMPVDVRDLAGGTNQFAWELYQQLRAEQGNLFLSPSSISTALAMTATGARGGTAEQMTQVLHLVKDPAKYAAQHQQMLTSLLDQPKGFELRIANALWGQVGHPFRQEFVDGLRQHFRAEAQSLRFNRDPERSRETINRWVEDVTKNKIQELIPSGALSAQTKLVLANAIYFKGKWATPFDKARTKPADFFPTTGEAFPVETMWALRDMGYAENDTVQVVEMPYEGYRLSMVVMLPKKKGGLDQIETGLTSTHVDTLLRGLRSRKVNLHLPRSKTTSSFDLKRTLQALGVRHAFESGVADFSGMDGTRELFIDLVLHKAFCEVNEEGTEAAASTVVGMKRAAAPREDPPVEFKADHPYLYMIRDTQTGCLLFLGRMTDPRQ